MSELILTAEEVEAAQMLIEVLDKLCRPVDPRLRLVADRSWTFDATTGGADA